MKIAILGFGEEGRSLWNYLKKNPKYRKAEIWVLDKDPKTRVPRGAKSFLGPAYLSGLERYDLVLRSPGIPFNIRPIERALRHKRTVSSATKLFFEESKKKGVKVIGVTGSKGKTTTAILIHMMLKAAGFRVFLAGNVGRSPLELLPKLRKGAWVVLELSSFQLQDLSVSPEIAVILDIFPEHLDVHRTVAEYYAAKGNICRHQGADGKAFYSGHNPITRWLAEGCPGQRFEVSERDPAPFSREDLRVPGLHVFRNALVAAKVAEHMGVKPERIRKVIQGFKGVEHRLELVRTKEEKGSRFLFVNDSASTNPQTAAAAVAAFRDKPHVLIAGGHDKRLDYRPLAEALRRSPNTKLVVLMGSNREKIGQAIHETRVPVLNAKTLRDAVVRGMAFLKKVPGPEKVLLFSPGAASFDQFRNYKDRGDQFRALAKKA